jgi:hypothetical protein
VIIRRDVYFDESVPFLKTPVEKRAFEELIIPVYICSRTTRSLEPLPASSSDSGEIIQHCYHLRDQDRWKVFLSLEEPY